MRAWHLIGTVAVVIARLDLLFAGTLVGMFGSFIFIVGLAGWSISWLAVGAVVMAVSNAADLSRCEERRGGAE